MKSPLVRFLASLVKDVVLILQTTYRSIEPQSKPTSIRISISKPVDDQWAKWFHRTFLAPVTGFGRACLIPNLSYLSETAASLLDRRLSTDIVPRTGLARLSSPSFFYDW